MNVDAGDERKRIVINATTNTSLMMAKVVVMFLVAPILVHGLGDTRYGIWMFISSITAYMALGNFGMNHAVMRFVAKYDGLEDHDRINRVLNTSLAVLACVGATLLAITFLVAYFYRSPFGAPAEMAQEARWLFVLLGVLVAVGLPTRVPFAVLAGVGRFPARNGISMMSLLLRNAMLVGVVWSGGGLVAVGVVLLINLAFDSGCSLVVARYYLPQLAFSPRYVDKETLRTIGSYGASIFIGGLATVVISQAAVFVIGAFMSPDSVTYFSISSSLRNQTISILAVIVFVLVPAVSKWEATGNYSAIRSLFIVATRYTFYIAAPVELGLLILGHPFLALWMGPRYADAGYVTLVILSVPLLFSAVGLVASRVLEGIGRVRPLAILTIMQAVLTVALSVALVRPFGIEGVAWGVSLALALWAPATTILVCRYLQVSFAALLRRALWGPLSASAVAGLVWVLAKQWLPPDNWAAFFAIGILGIVPYSIIVIVLEPGFRRLAASMVGGFAKRAF